MDKLTPREIEAPATDEELSLYHSKEEVICARQLAKCQDACPQCPMGHLIMIKDGAEYPIFCDGKNHYYYENLAKGIPEKEPFEPCQGTGRKQDPESIDKIARWLYDNSKSDPYFNPSLSTSHWYWVAHQILALILPKDKQLDDIKNCLDCAREAIVDAICCEDGLDGGAGEKVIKWITDILGDYDEWIKTHSEE